MDVYTASSIRGGIAWHDIAERLCEGDENKMVQRMKPCNEDLMKTLFLYLLFPSALLVAQSRWLWQNPTVNGFSG